MCSIICRLQGVIIIPVRSEQNTFVTLGQASGSPVPYFIYFEFYDPPKTIKVWAYFSDFKIGKIYFTFCLSSIKSVELDEDSDDQNI